jgi:hypothetical protein
MPNSEIRQKGKSLVALPEIGQRVMVQAIGFRGLAYRNDRGEWIKFPDNKKLIGKVIVILPQ